MATATDIAKLLAHLASIDPEGESMTPMKLHKLLYYCQGWHLAWYGEPLFSDPIEAWEHGPVVRSVRKLSWGRGADPIPDMGEPAGIEGEVKVAVAHVWRRYEPFSASGLRKQTHAEKPWQNHYEPDGEGRCENVIPVAELAEFFGDKLREEAGEEPGAEREFLQAVRGGGLKTHSQVMKELGW